MGSSARLGSALAHARAEVVALELEVRQSKAEAFESKFKIVAGNGNTCLTTGKQEFEDALNLKPEQQATGLESSSPHTPLIGDVDAKLLDLGDAVARALQQAHAEFVAAAEAHSTDMVALQQELKAKRTECMALHGTVTKQRSVVGQLESELQSFRNLQSVDSSTQNHVAHGRRCRSGPVPWNSLRRLHQEMEEGDSLIRGLVRETERLQRELDRVHGGGNTSHELEHNHMKAMLAEGMGSLVLELSEAVRCSITLILT
jgi:hypothetical protein